MRPDPGEELHEPAHLHRRLLPLIVALALAVASAGCGTGASTTSSSPDAATDARGPSFGDLDAGDVYDLDASLGTRVSLRLRSCNGIEGCHMNAAGQLSFPQGNETSELVGVPSSERPDLLRVRPGDTTHSYLLLKVRGAGGITGNEMPPGVPYDPRLDALFSSWIEAGAPPP